MSVRGMRLRLSWIGCRDRIYGVAFLTFGIDYLAVMILLGLDLFGIVFDLPPTTVSREITRSPPDNIWLYDEHSDTAG